MEMRPTYVIATALIKKNGKFLIAKRAVTKKFAPGQWEFISGFMDTPESAEEVILREIKEELDVAGKITKSADTFTINDDEGRWVVIPFLIDIGNDEININQKDHSEIKWVNSDELKEYQDIVPFLNNGLINI